VDRSHTNLVRSDLVDPQLVGEGVARDRQHVARDDESDHAGQGQTTYNNRQTEALHLPPAILEKFYHANAERIFKLDAAWKRTP
jgi:hypothetical protein